MHTMKSLLHLYIYAIADTFMAQSRGESMIADNRLSALTVRKGKKTVKDPAVEITIICQHDRGGRAVKSRGR